MSTQPNNTGKIALGVFLGLFGFFVVLPAGIFFVIFFFSAFEQGREQAQKQAAKDSRAAQEQTTRAADIKRRNDEIEARQSTAEWIEANANTNAAKILHGSQ